jgi:hypothetical protein
MTIGAITDSRAEIVATLHGRHFDFDAGAVDKDCPAAFREMATTRP